MKKIMTSMLACAMAFGLAAPAFAAPQYVEGSEEQLANTVVGFSTGKEIELNLTQIEGKADVSFDLGANANYYNVKVDVKENGKQVDAEYSKSKKAIVVRPSISPKTVEEEEYEIEIEVVDRKNRDTVADGYKISGMLQYDDLQYVESDERYNNKNGVLYDFQDGEKDVEVRIDKDVTVNIKDGRGIYNLHMNDERNESIDYMFSKHELKYYHFAAQPKFSSDVEVTINMAEEEHLYEYLNGKLSKVKGAYDERDGYTFKTRQLGTYIVSDLPMAEGEVDESINLVKPENGSGNTGSSDKDNPTTGASEMPAALAAASLFALAAFAARKLRK